MGYNMLGWRDSFYTEAEIMQKLRNSKNISVPAINSEKIFSTHQQTTYLISSKEKTYAICDDRTKKDLFIIFEVDTDDFKKFKIYSFSTGSVVGLVDEENEIIYSLNTSIALSLIKIFQRGVQSEFKTKTTAV